MKKKLFPIFLAISILIGYAAVLLYVSGLLEIMGFFPPSQKKIEKMYYENESELLSICDFLWEDQYSESRIELYDSAPYTVERYKYNDRGGMDKEILEITEEDIINSFETIESNGFERVLKEYNYISFQVWGSFGESVSLVFSPNGEPDLSKQNLIDSVIERIEPTGWFYCRETFE